ncbi:MAG TPA: hypothetical protein VI029_12735, partial [Mycobacterium sp.]
GMASLRTRTRKDGTEYYAVLYRLRGKQTSTSFDLPYVVRCIAFGASPLGISPRLARGMISQ